MRRTPKIFLKTVLLLLTVLTLWTPNAEAVLKDVGPTNPVIGFPNWYRDTSTNITGFPLGLPLEPCISQTVSPLPGAGGGYMCNLLPEPGFVPASPIVFPTNFPSEVFWWAGDALISPTDPGNTTGIDAGLILGLEGAFGAGPVTPGDQVSFARIRIRVDVPAGKGGTYRIIHPFGTSIFNNVGTGVNAINFTEDIGIGAAGDFRGALGGKIGPFLVWTPDQALISAGLQRADGVLTIGATPELYVGDPNLPHTVTGSPFGTNFFRIERLDASGNVVESVQQNSFSLTGKIYTTPIPTPLKITRATYLRDTAVARIDVFATTGATSNLGTPSNVQITGAGLLPITMSTDSAGRFFTHQEYPANTLLPGNITATNVADAGPVPVDAVLADEVAVTQATYDIVAKALTVVATSSDKLFPPTLTAVGFGILTGGQLTVNNVNIPPPTVTVVSSAGGSDTEPILVRALNNPPIAANDSATTTTLGTVIINVIANDTDPDLGDVINPASVAIVTLPTSGTATANGDGTVTYVSTSAGFAGTDTFTYTVRDSLGAVSNAATVTVTINNPPNATPNVASTNEDTAVVINVAADDSDPDLGDSVVLSSVTVSAAPVNGTAVAVGDGTVRYTPNLNFNGIDTFRYTIRDTHGAVSAAATVTVTVAPVADAPLALADTATTNEDALIAIDVLLNDIHPDGLPSTINAATLAIVTPPLNGTATVVAGRVNYQPNPNFNGADSFVYSVRDSLGVLSNSARVDVTVQAQPDPPVANADAATTPEDTAAVINVAANDTDPDGDLVAASVTIATPPTSGTAVANGNGAVTYTPNANFSGTDSFTYTIKDAANAVSAAATVSITVTAVNDPPVANNDAQATPEDTPKTFAVTGNDTDVDGTVVATSVTIATQPANGTAAVDVATGAVTYTPAPNFAGTDTFTYTVQDNLGAASAPGTVTMTVSAVNDAPVARNDVATTTAGIPRIINVIANDSDVDGTIVANSVAVTQPASGGTVVANPDGTVTFTPAAGFAGVASFTYTVTDNAGAVSAAATVTVSVTTPADTVTVLRAQFRTTAPGVGDWQIEGNGVAGRTITIHIGRDLTGTVLGTATVAADGRWRFQRTGGPAPDASNTVSVISSGLGTRLAFPVAVR